MRTGGGRRVNHICNIGRRATRLREIMLASIWGSTQLPLLARHDKTLSRIDRAITPLSPARIRNRRLANRRKVQTRAASRAAANKEIRNANGNELFALTSSFV